jgi:E3 ubiquitin-protein ligase synoviolin
MDQIPAPGPPRLFHIRVASILTLLTAIDFSLVIYTLDTISSNGVSSMVLFVTEFVILLASITAIGARYTVGLVDLRRARGREDAPAWEEKSMWLFYINLVQGEHTAQASYPTLSWCHQLMRVSTQTLSSSSPTSPSSP